MNINDVNYLQMYTNIKTGYEYYHLLFPPLFSGTTKPR